MTKLETILQTIAQFEVEAIADGTYQLPARQRICRAAGVAASYMQSGTIPAVEAFKAWDAAKKRLDRLAAREERQDAIDTLLQRCCGCLELKKPGLSRAAKVYGRLTTQHFCLDCLAQTQVRRSA